MEENKQETIVKLYSLRAGLSLLSQIRDEASDQRFLIYQIKEDIRKSEQKQKNLQHEIEIHHSQTVGKTQDEIKRLTEYIPRYDCEVLQEAKRMEEHNKRLKNSFRNSIICLFVFIGSIFACALSISLSEYDFSYVMLINSILLAIISLAIFFKGGLWYDLGNLSRTYKNIDPKKSLGKTDPRDTIKEKKKSLEKLTKEHEAYDYEHRMEIAKLQREIDDMHKTIKKDEDEKLRPIIERFKVTYKAVQDQFCEFIDERDWGNVDLIIFNYETGRALDLRDALMQVDNERRNERLVDAIQDASMAICSSIGRGFGALQKTFDRHMDALEGRIKNLSTQMLESSSRQIAAINENSQTVLESTYRQIDAIAESGRAQQALLDKMNTSSDYLAEDIQYMCQIADISYYNR